MTSSLATPEETTRNRDLAMAKLEVMRQQVKATEVIRRATLKDKFTVRQLWELYDQKHIQVEKILRANPWYAMQSFAKSLELDSDSSPKKGSDGQYLGWSRDLSTLTEDSVKTWRERQVVIELEPTTINMRGVYLKSILAFGVDQNRLAANPWGKMKPLDESKRKLPVLSREQSDR